MFLTEAETKVLTELGDRRWKTPSEIAKETGLHHQHVRSALAQLASRRLAERGGWGDSMRWGEWRIVDAGVAELARRNQLELFAELRSVSGLSSSGPWS